MTLFGSKLAGIKAPISQKAKEWLAKMKREGKCWIVELKKYKE